MSGVSSFGRAESGGVAFFAHIGGFLAGLLLIRPFLGRRPRQHPGDWQGWRPPRRGPSY
jgi:membrane associated rhomboid family serine protease